MFEPAQLTPLAAELNVKASSSVTRCVLIKPGEEFPSFAHALAAAAVGDPGLSARLLGVVQLPLIVDGDGVPIWHACLFLAEMCLRSRSVTGDTARSYAEALLAWLRFLEGRREPAEAATEETLGLYRTSISRANSKNGRPFATATINHRVTVAARFQLWGQKSHQLLSPLGALLLDWDKDRKREPMSPLLGARHGRRRPLAPAVLQRLPCVLSRDEAARLFSVAPQPYRLMFKWALVTGIRRFEVCALRIDSLPTPEQLDYARDGLASLDLVRKGGRVTTVQVPCRLVEETRWYVLSERPSPKQGYEALVFLNQRGRGISKSGLSAVFRRCADQIGSAATLHHLRHTFAVRVLGMLSEAERQGAEINPIKTVQMLLGHASVETTEIYLRAAEATSDVVMNALEYLYGGSVS